jgi:hypothetical protein
MDFLNALWPSCHDLDNTLRIDAGFCRGGFDFSLLFEETILEILPISLILIVIPFRLWHLFQKRHKVERSLLLFLKLVSWHIVQRPSPNISRLMLVFLLCGRLPGWDC